MMLKYMSPQKVSKLIRSDIGAAIAIGRSPVGPAEPIKSTLAQKNHDSLAEATD